MIEITTQNRNLITQLYIKEVFETLDLDVLYSYAKLGMKHEADSYTVKELEEQILDCCPQILQ